MKEPKVIEIFADNGEHSHWQLIDENGEILWSEEPTEVKNNAVLPHVSGSALTLCKNCGGFVFTMDGKQCVNCGHYR